MNETIHFTVIGDPKGQPRTKTVMKGRKSWNYTPPVADGWKKDVVRAADYKLAGRMIDKPVAVGIAFYFDRPKHHFRVGKFAGLMKPDAPIYHTSKPDIDNLQKAVYDALVSRGYIRDDALIVHAQNLKHWADDGRLAGADITIEILGQTPEELTYQEDTTDARRIQCEFQSRSGSAETDGRDSREA